MPWESLREEWSQVLRNFETAARTELGVRTLTKTQQDQPRHSMPGPEAEPSDP